FATSAQCRDDGAAPRPQPKRRCSAETAVLCAPWSRHSTVVSADSLALRRCFGAASLFRTGLQRRARGEEQRRAGAVRGARGNSQGRGGARAPAGLRPVEAEEGEAEGGEAEGGGAA